MKEIDPEHIPNWMRAFYDDFKPELPPESDLMVDDYPSQAYLAAGL